MRHLVTSATVFQHNTAILPIADGYFRFGFGWLQRRIVSISNPKLLLALELEAYEIL